MANIEKSNKKEKVVYRDGLGKIKNPSKSLFGKIMIWVLSFLMAGTALVTLGWLRTKVKLLAQFTSNFNI